MGRSRFLAIEAWPPQKGGKAEFAASLSERLCASGCSHYLTDTDLGNSVSDESHPCGSLPPPQRGHGAASLSSRWMYSHTHRVIKLQLSKAHNSAKSVPVFRGVPGCTHQGDPFSCEHSFAYSQLLCPYRC